MLKWKLVFVLKLLNNQSQMAKQNKQKTIDSFSFRTVGNRIVLFFIYLTVQGALAVVFAF